MSILFLIESPGKIKKISSILGKDYIVKASVGHFRDLDPKKMSIDFDNNFEPIYIITKKDVVATLKSSMKNVKMVYIASDEDREGESIGDSIYQILKPKQYKRLRFNAITKKSILDAINNPGEINQNMVCAQKARRVIDRLYGYLISPILQRQIGGKLSAGRVQSVAAKIIIDKENEVKDFLEKNKDSTYFKVNGIFSKMKANLYLCEDNKPHLLDKSYKGKIAHLPLVDEDVNENPNTIILEFLKNCQKSEFIVHAVFDKMAIRSSAPPFTTSTLQQEAHRKFGMSVDSTMRTAQKLYEGGFITYMRTDSVAISEEGQKDIKAIIEKEYGKDYYQKNIYKNKIANAAEAHECIRPTHADLLSIENESNDSYEIKLYKLIWQRTIASQMKPANINVTTIQISISEFISKKITPFYFFTSQVEKVIFAGFMKVYTESIDDPTDEEATNNDFKGKIPKVGDTLLMEEINAKQEYLRPPPRYTEASLVKKLEALGIGRPSTFVNTIKTIMSREYVTVGNVEGIKKNIMKFWIKKKDKKISQESTSILLGKETKKIIPTPLGITVNDFLFKHFEELMDYKFTANMEEELDDISNGKKKWQKVVKKFYDKINPIIEELNKMQGGTRDAGRLLGKDKEGNEVYAVKTKYGPTVMKKTSDKPIYANLDNSLTLETVKLRDALKLFLYPKLLGEHENKEIWLHKGKYGFYLVHDKKNYAIKVNDDNINLKIAIETINNVQQNNLGEFNITINKKSCQVFVKTGLYGPYVQVVSGKQKNNYPIPKNIEISKLDDQSIINLITRKNSVKNSVKNTPTKNSVKNTSKKYNGSKSAKKTNKKD